MIRIIKQKLIIPQGDTGEFSIPVLENIPIENAEAIFSIFTLYNRLYQQTQVINGNTITFSLTHEETEKFPLGEYFWDVKIYVNPNEYDLDGIPINGEQVHSYYAGFKLPECVVVPYKIKY